MIARKFFKRDRETYRKLAKVGTTTIFSLMTPQVCNWKVTRVGIYKYDSFNSGYSCESLSWTINVSLKQKMT